MTKLSVSIDMYSGRPNPELILEGEAAVAALSLLRPARLLPAGEQERELARVLGYRGLTFIQLGEPVNELPRRVHLAAGRLFGVGLRHRAEVQDAEERLLAEDGPVGKLLDPEFRSYLWPQVAKLHKFVWTSEPQEPASGTGPVECGQGPDADLDWWSDMAIQNQPPCDRQLMPRGARQCTNNCYNYATNLRTDSFAQPGKGGGHPLNNNRMTSLAIRLAAWYDGLLDAPAANNACPAEGHLIGVALATPPLANSPDFHFWRKNRDGYWSSKAGIHRATDRDANNNRIADPRDALGLYPEWCGFMVIVPGHAQLA
jgi:hypothetical protein